MYPATHYATIPDHDQSACIDAPVHECVSDLENTMKECKQTDSSLHPEKLSEYLQHESASRKLGSSLVLMGLHVLQEITLHAVAMHSDFTVTALHCICDSRGRNQSKDFKNYNFVQLYRILGSLYKWVSPQKMIYEAAQPAKQ